MLATYATRIEAALERVLRRVAEGDGAAAEGARHSLGRVRPALAGWDEDDGAPRRSTLSMVGCPVELSYTSGDPSLRYTVEVCMPEIAPDSRLDHAERLFRELAGVPIPPELSRALHAGQACGPLKYGAWIGGRHRGDSCRYKLYAEVAPGEAMLSWERAQFRRPLPLPTRACPCMVGYEAGSGTLEIYYRIGLLADHEIATLMSRIDLEDRAGDLLERLHAASSAPCGAGYTAGSRGFSYAISPSGEPLRFAAFAVANALFGGDGRIRRAMLRLAASSGWDVAEYEWASRALDGARGAPTRHGLLAVAVGRQGAPSIGIGLAPVLEAR